MSHAPSKKPRRLFRRLLVSLFATVGCFAALEIGFRLYEAWRIQGGEIWAVYDPVLGYRLNPAFGDHNEIGLRDHEVGPKGGRFRILMLGDSVAYYGTEIEDTFVARTEARLQAREDLLPLEVLNAGVKGYTTHQELLFLKERGLALEPDLVGVAFVLNDLHDFLHRFRVRDGRIVGQSYEFTDEAVAGVDSLLYRTLRRSRFLVWLRHHVRVGDPSEALGTDGFAFDLRPDFRTAWLDERWTEVEAQLAELQSLGNANGFRVFVVCFPFGDQYREEYLSRDRVYVLKPQRNLARICDRLGIPLLDLYPDLDATALEGDKIHLTERGRVAVAQKLADFLVDRELIPRGE